jgi:hypothetical protein
LTSPNPPDKVPHMMLETLNARATERTPRVRQSFFSGFPALRFRILIT